MRVEGVARSDRGTSLRGVRVAAACTVIALAFLGVAAPAAATVVSHGVSTAKYGSDSTTSLTLPVPAGAQTGDVLVASLGFGKSGAKALPVLTAPTGWALINRSNQSPVGSLAVYRHVLAAGESTFTWTTDVSVGGVAFVAAFAGLDAENPVDVAGGAQSGRGLSVATPSLNTTAVGDLLLASYFAYNSRGVATSWTPASGMSELGDGSNSGSRSASIDYAIQTAPGTTGAKNATASTQQDYGLGVLTALRPATSATDTTPPSIGGVGVGQPVGPTSVTVSWATDEPADSLVEYGVTTAYGASSAPDSTLRSSHAVVLSGLSPDTTYHYRVESKDASGNVAVSSDFSFRTGVPAAGPVPVIVDTDIFSDADDVGALATAFALQLKGEAHVVAIGVNTRTSRPAVATNSWKCAAAVAQFYGAANTPIGTDMPNNGTATNTVDFVGSCATRALPGTPTPPTAVSVFRSALAGQPDGSVVVVEAGYSKNLSDLLSSPADSTSPLTGHDLVARKVRMLVIMGGGYPSRNGENNLNGNPAAAQNVSANWPTKIVWSGYEVGDQIHTGNTISRTHPANSPVRVAYEAFVGANNWIYSYDLTAVYHAVRPSDPVLSEVGPGTNTITSTGANTFTTGSGNQYYLSLSSATTLDTSIESLLDTLPTTQQDTTPPVLSGVGVGGSVGPTSATVSWTTDEPADGLVEYGTTTAYGSSTPLDTTLRTGHSVALSGLSPGTTYHYRVKSKDTAGNLAASPDATFQTAASTTPVGPQETFDANALDPTKWAVTAAGSTVIAANQELEITHATGAWTKGSIETRTPHDQTGRALQLQVKRAANNGLGGSTYGETSIFLVADATHSVEFFIAGGSLTAWINNGSTETNLTPSWPRYDATAMRWLRFRESGGMLYWEYATGTASPGTWTKLAAVTSPFPLTAVTLRITAGSNVSSTDVASFDDISTS